MVNALFVTWDGGGNLPPALDIARELQRRGGSARFLGHEPQRQRIEDAGFAFEPFTSGRQIDSADRVAEPRATFRQVRVFADRRIGDDAVASLARQPADVVIVDCLLVGAMNTLLESGRAAVSLVHMPWSFLQAGSRGPFGVLIRLFGGKIGDALDNPGLILATTTLELEEKAEVPAHVRHTGVVLSGQPRPAHPSAGRPRVLVSLSSTDAPGQTRSLQRILDALDGLELDAIVTTGLAIDPAELRAPADAQVHRYADHGEILPTVSLVIGHGGHSTTVKALSHDVPLLVLPQHALRDQPAIGRAVERIGAGLTLKRTAAPAAIRDAVLTLLADGPHRAAAARIGAALRERDGAVVAADLLEQHVQRDLPTRAASR